MGRLSSKLQSMKERVHSSRFFRLFSKHHVFNQQCIIDLAVNTKTEKAKADVGQTDAPSLKSMIESDASPLESIRTNLIAGANNYKFSLNVSSVKIYYSRLQGCFRYKDGWVVPLGYLKFRRRHNQINCNLV